jgi:hypothetical protein
MEPVSWSEKKYGRRVGAKKNASVNLEKNPIHATNPPNTK